MPADPSTRNGSRRPWFLRVSAPGLDEPPTDPRPRRRWLWSALVLLVVLAAGFALGTGVAAGQDNERAPAPEQPVRVVQRLVRPSPACTNAVDQADKSLALAVKVQKALADHTLYMDQMLRGTISPRDALAKGMPSLVAGAHESANFDKALAAYRAVVQECDLGTTP
jgi:hypothetical protein